ncbi:uncharacterized protein PAC_11383 [Phialocephala subalpina]|uniref:Zn(2)-C6 fungal-type domain-containing protein n=1 Tax=Phialocephala subalpina TaxID=576137 RepID=A0A1L7X926_9HELO|nr:uncharacterized protein PAC_11383 [Phialocephala subalpina]
MLKRELVLPSALIGQLRASRNSVLGGVLSLHDTLHLIVAEGFKSTVFHISFDFEQLIEQLVSRSSSVHFAPEHSKTASLSFIPLSCPDCAAEKQASRHVRYCRTKAKDGVSTRRKSCVACIKAKTRCGMTLPSCSRCSSKGLQCLYKSANAPSSPEVQGVHVEEPALVGAAPPLLAEIALDSSPSATGQVRSPRDLWYLSSGNGFDHNLSTNTWQDLYSNAETNNIEGPIFPNEILDLHSFSWNYPSDTFLPQIHHFKDRVVLGSFYVIDVQLPSVELDTKTILEKRDVRAGPHGSTLGRAYCMTALRSYPAMLCSDVGTLPPFVHARSRPRNKSRYVDDETVALPEPLEICISIMRMYTAKTPGNLPFIWHTIGAESQRIEGNYRSWDTWNILASVQAMTIYLILGLLEDSSSYVADRQILRSMCNTTRVRAILSPFRKNCRLIFSLQRIAEKLHPIGRPCNEELPQDRLPTWEDWAQSECQRRTAVILIIIIHLFSIEHGSLIPPCGGFSALPLPCSKKLWQASDLETWEKEYRKEYMGGGGEGLKRVPTYRDLLPDLEDLEGPTSSSRMEWLSEWFLGMDEVGTLITMAISTL